MNQERLNIRETVMLKVGDHVTAAHVDAALEKIFNDHATDAARLEQIKHYIARNGQRKRKKRA